jgi:hypothetical protein
VAVASGVLDGLTVGETVGGSAGSTVSVVVGGCGIRWVLHADRVNPITKMITSARTLFFIFHLPTRIWCLSFKRSLKVFSR